MSPVLVLFLCAALCLCAGTRVCMRLCAGRCLCVLVCVCVCVSARACAGMITSLLVAAHKHTTAREILLWMIPSEPPKALQASECSELLDPMRASCQIPAQH